MTEVDLARELIYLEAFSVLALIGFGLAGITLYLMAKDGRVRLRTIVLSNLIWPFANFFIAPVVTPGPVLYQAGVSAASLLALHAVVLAHSISLAHLWAEGRVTKIAVIGSTVAAVCAAYVVVRLTF